MNASALPSWDARTQRLVVAALASLAIAGTAAGLGVLGGEQPARALIVASAALLGLLCLASPDLTTFVVVAILYSNAAAVAVNVHGLPYYFAVGFLVPLVIPLAYHLIVRREPIVITPAFPLLFGFLAVQVLGAALARDVATARDQLVVFLVGGLGLYFVLTNVIRDLRVLTRMVWLIVLVGALLGAISAFQTLTRTYGNDYWGFAGVNFPGIGIPDPEVVRNTTPRLTGPIGEQNRYGQILLVLIPLAAMLTWSARSWPARVVAGGATVLITIGMATTLSRGAALGLAAIVVAMLLFRYLRLVHLAVVVLGIAVLLAMFPRYAERLSGLQALTRLDVASGGAPVRGDVGNLRSRATESLAALLVFADHPLIGVGPGLFPSYYQQYAREVSAAQIDTRVDLSEREAHNLYTGIAAEYGGLGLACFLGILSVTIRDLLRARRRWLAERPEIAHLAAGLVLAIIGYMVSGLFLHLKYERYLWLLLAIAGVAGVLARREASRARPAEAPAGRRGRWGKRHPAAAS